HAPQRLVEDPDLGALARWISRRTGLPLARSVGYATPGSLGDWSADRRLPEVTIELPHGGPSEAVVAAMADVLAGRAPG
ncbi:MAG: murein tripeptide amidase MpaA, partial [Thermoleophilia bacterium]|nr:murein tripeptide amidase MpaA [Thermoleophilia bacterium]